MKKFAKHLWSLTFPAVVLFLVIFGNMSSAAPPADGGPIMCPPKRPADGGICDPKKAEQETPPIPPLSDGGSKIEKKKVKIQFKGRELDFTPTGSAKVAPASPKPEAKAPAVDAGVPEWLTSRRAEVIVVCGTIAEMMQTKTKVDVMLSNILLAETYTQKSDAAVCVYAVGKGKASHEVANVWLFNQGQWSVLPTDLIEVVPGQNF